MHGKITRQSWWNLRRASEKAIPNQAPENGEGAETGWRAPLVGKGTVRLSSKGESDRITRRSALQIRPPQPRFSFLSATSTNPATIRIVKFLNACRCVGPAQSRHDEMF